MATSEALSSTRYLTGPQLDQRLGISKATRYRWMAEGYLPKPVRLGGGRGRWALTEIEAFEHRAAQDRGGRR